MPCRFASWTLHMASIMICSSLWGVRLGEWAGASPRALAFIRAGIGTLVLSTVVVVRLPRGRPLHL